MMPRKQRQVFQFNIVSHQRYFTLQSSAEMDIAVLNTNISRCHRDLESSTSIRYEGFVSVDTWKAEIQAWKKTGKAGSMSININIYGTRDHTETVGRVFSKARLYLQHPYYCDDTKKYENPHYISFQSIPDTALDNPSAHISMIRTTSALSQFNVSSLLENLQQHEYLRQIQVDRRIKTILRRFASLIYQ